MKKVFLLFAFLLACSHFGIAQKIMVGPRAGFNLSGINGLENNHIRAGWVMGAFIMYYKPSQRLGVSTDVLVSSRGGRSYITSNSDSVSEVWDSYYNINYLEIPVLMNVFLFKENPNFRTRIFAGPSLALKMNATQNLQYHKYQLTGENHIALNTKTSSNYKNLDMGIVVGLGFTYSMSEKTCFNLDVRYLKGLIDIRNQTQFYSSALYNQNISLLLGIGYQIGK